MVDTWKVTIVQETTVTLPPVEERKFPDCPQAEALNIAEERMHVEPGSEFFRRGEVAPVSPS